MASIATAVYAPIMKVQRLFRKEVGPSGPKRHPTPAGVDDIVSSALKYAAVHKRTVLGAASQCEGKVDYDNQQGISVGKILGFLKPKFQSMYAGNTVQDFGVASVFVAQ